MGRSGPHGQVYCCLFCEPAAQLGCGQGFGDPVALDGIAAHGADGFGGLRVLNAFADDIKAEVIGKLDDLADNLVAGFIGQDVLDQASVNLHAGDVKARQMRQASSETDAEIVQQNVESGSPEITDDRCMRGVFGDVAERRGFQYFDGDLCIGRYRHLRPRRPDG